MDIPSEMLAAKVALEQTLPFVSGVVGIDIGLREVGLEITDELVIRIFVADATNPPFELQGLIDGTLFPVVVAQRDFGPLVDNARYETIVGGISIGAVHEIFTMGVGTLGGLARDTLFPGPVVGVSCAHVIAQSDSAAVQQGDPILQPQGSVANSRRIGRLFRWSDEMDVAVFALDGGVPAEMRIEDVGPYAGMAEAKLGDLVFKRGRSTLLTRGRVSGHGLKLFGARNPKNGFEIWSHAANPPIFCDFGDSGSLIINQQDQVVGLLSMAGIFPTTGVGVPRCVSAFAVQILPAAAAVGISF